MYIVFDIFPTGSDNEISKDWQKTIKKWQKTFKKVQTLYLNHPRKANFSYETKKIKTKILRPTRSKSIDKNQKYLDLKLKKVIFVHIESFCHVRQTSILFIKNQKLELILKETFLVGLVFGQPKIAKKNKNNH